MYSFDHFTDSMNDVIITQKLLLIMSHVSLKMSDKSSTDQTTTFFMEYDSYCGIYLYKIHWS